MEIVMVRRRLTTIAMDMSTDKQATASLVSLNMRVASRV